MKNGCNLKKLNLASIKREWMSNIETFIDGNWKAGNLWTSINNLSSMQKFVWQILRCFLCQNWNKNLKKELFFFILNILNGKIVHLSSALSCHLLSLANVNFLSILFPGSPQKRKQTFVYRNSTSYRASFSLIQNYFCKGLSAISLKNIKLH